MALDFYESINYGKQGEKIFREEFLDFMRLNYVQVTDCQQFQIVDTDFDSSFGTYEVKLNYKDDKNLIFEDYTNINTKLGKESKGWVYKSKADKIVFISKSTHTMVMVPFTDEFKTHYETIKEEYPLIKNSVSQKGSSKWQSAFRRVPLTALNGYYGFYKKMS